MSLLNAPVLRSVGVRLRARHPELYARLNAVRRELVAGPRELSAHQRLAFGRFCRFAPVRGSRVLEVGADREMKLMRALRARGAAEVAGVNPAREFWTDAAGAGGAIDGGGGLRLLDASAERLPFDDGSFDSVFSISVFEHLLDLGAALAEMRRVLRPGGLVYANFGPIWSGCKGHHVNAKVGDREVHHFQPETNPLPDFAHLLLGRDELRGALSGRTAPELVEPIVEWVFESRVINRLFHHDYLDLFDASAMFVVSLVPEVDPVDPRLARLLAFRHPRESRFDVTNLEVVLRR